jgi:hypothetical protein
MTGEFAMLMEVSARAMLMLRAQWVQLMQARLLVNNST